MLNLWKKFTEGYDGDDEINFDDDVPPQVLPEK